MQNGTGQPPGDVEYSPQVGDYVDLDVSLRNVHVVDVDFGDLTIVLGDERRTFAPNGSWSARLAEPNNWPPMAGEIWRTRLPRPAVDGSQAVLWLAHWRDGGEAPYLALVNGLGDVATPDELIEQCRPFGILPELLIPERVAVVPAADVPSRPVLVGPVAEDERCPEGALPCDECVSQDGGAR